MRTAHRGVILGSITGLAAAAALVLGGCTDVTPELDTLSQRHADIDNKITVVNDTNLRMFNQDLGRVFLLDRPSRLTPQPIPY